MSNGPDNIATNPEALMAEMDCVNNAIIAARFGDPPGGMVAGMAPDGIASANVVYTPSQSVLGMQLCEGLGPAAHVPAFKSAFAATFTPDPELATAPDEPNMRPA